MMFCGLKGLKGPADCVTPQGQHPSGIGRVILLPQATSDLNHVQIWGELLLVEAIFDYKYAASV